MNKIYAVARREFLATVRTRAFVLSVVLMPGLIIGGIYGGEMVMEASQQEERPTRVLAVVDHTGHVLPEFERQIDSWNERRPNQKFAVDPRDPESATQEELAAAVNTGELYAYIIIHEDAVALDGAGCAVGRQDNQLETGRELERALNEAVFAVRCRENNLDPLAVTSLRAPVPVNWQDLTTGEAVDGRPEYQLLAAFAFMFLLFMGTFGISQGLLTTLIEEKGSRIVEVLLSAVSPTQLLAGKIVGMVCVGLLLLIVWGGAGYYSAQHVGYSELVTGSRLLIAALYFLPGFLLIASILAAIGSACNELKDAQSMVFPLSLITIIPMIFWFHIAEHPDSAMSVALSFVPPITAFVMMLRFCVDPLTPVWQIAATLGVLWMSVLITIWAAGKIFRVGVLMYGKPPSPIELLRWVRYR